MNLALTCETEIRLDSEGEQETQCFINSASKFCTKLRSRGKEKPQGVSDVAEDAFMSHMPTNPVIYSTLYLHG